MVNQQEISPYLFFTIDTTQGIIRFSPEQQQEKDCGIVYTELRTETEKYPSRLFQWQLVQQESNSGEMVGILPDLELSQRWQFKRIDATTLGLTVKIHSERELKLLEVFFSLSCIQEYWRWGNSIGYGAFSYPNQESDTLVPLWAGNPSSDGLTVFSGRKELPDIQIVSQPGTSYSSAKLAVNPKTKRHELCYYRIDEHYGPVLLPNGEYILFDGLIRFHSAEPINTPYLEVVESEKNNPKWLIIGANYPAFVNYLIEQNKLKTPNARFAVVMEAGTQYSVANANAVDLFIYPNLLQ
ncbi:MAG: hypothetical protein QME64_04115, partial [bacterium]|nr:hypothetical protein [bacterium]